MEELWSYHDNLIKNTQTERFRYLYNEIDWSVRMMGIKGPRGTGKTTMMLQYIKGNFETGSPLALYATLEHPYFFTNSLYDFAKEFYINGGRHLFIDEVHKYERWSRELKVIYDGFPELKIVFSASSALDIFRGESDLSRRASVYQLHGLSFREYINFSLDQNFEKIEIENIFTDARRLSAQIAEQIQVIPLLKAYLKNGYYPFHLEIQESDYLQRLVQVINTVIDTDLNYIEGYSAEANKKVKKLLRVVAESVPFKPNVSEISRKTGVSRDLIYLYLGHLESAHLISQLHQTGKGVSTLQKPDKLYLDNSNLSYALFSNPEIGNMRETFIINQLRNAGLEVSLPKKGDFYLDESGITIEVGGKNKDGKQVAGIENAFLAKDDIETGIGNTIPLWLFGFLY